MGAYIAKLSTTTANDVSATINAKSSNIIIPLVEEIQRLAADDPHRDPTTHEELLSKIHALNLAVETPLETIYRLGHQSWQNAAVRVALDLGIFDVLMEREPEPVSAEDLAFKRDANVVLIARIARVIAALGLCVEVSVGKYAANDKTAIMTIPQGTTSFKFWVDIAMPTAVKLPTYLRATDYQNPYDNQITAFAYAFGSEFWTWLARNPEHGATFKGFMSSRREGRPSWFDIYPLKKELKQFAELVEIGGQDAVALVDVGGNQGTDLINLKGKYPDLQGRLVLQDLPDVVAKTKFKDPSIQAMEHNFFDPQPIKHAPIYHFRAIFHDWSDAACIQILTHTAHAMKRGFSKLLISEFVLADEGTGLFPASLDLQMMGLHAGKERSENQWKTLLTEAGLEVVRVWRLVGKGGEGVVEGRLV